MSAITRFCLCAALATCAFSACDDEESGAGGDADVTTDAADDAPRDRAVDFNADAASDLADTGDATTDADSGGDATPDTAPDADDEGDGDLPDLGDDGADEPDGDLPDSGADAEADPDVETDDGGGTAGECTSYAADLVDGSLGETIGEGVDTCVSGPCGICASLGGAGETCGDGMTLASCVLDCFQENDFGPCTEGGCDDGLTCDTSVEPSVCRSDAIAGVSAALEASELDLECLGCYADVPQCIYSQGCGTACEDGGCDCDLCLCDNFCSQTFGTCTGLAAELQEPDCDQAPDDDLSCAFGATGFCPETLERCF